MKKIIVFVLSALFLSCSQNTQENYNCEGAQSWDYPVKPGMEEWKQFQSNEEMVKACQIPENLFFCLSTNELTDLCLQYPLLSDIFAHNFLDNGLDVLFIDFNGIRELYKRSDVVSSLTKLYMEYIQNLSYLEEEHELMEVFYFYSTIGCLDALLSRLDGSIDNLKEILKVLVYGYEKISILNHYSRGHMLEYNYFARANIIIKMCEQCVEEMPRGMSNAVFSPHFPDAETADIINTLSYQLIKK